MTGKRENDAGKEGGGEAGVTLGIAEPGPGFHRRPEPQKRISFTGTFRCASPRPRAGHHESLRRV